MPAKRGMKRELILDTAFGLILQNGYLNTKIIDIANKAGIGKGTVYEYFESKESLLLELIDTRVKQDYRRVCEAAEKASTYRQKLAEYFRLEVAVTAKYKENVTDFRNDFMNNDAEISVRIAEAIHGVMTLQFEYVRSAVKKGVAAGEFRDVDPNMAAACFMGGISFYLHMLHFGMPCREDSFLDCIFNGLIV